MTKGFRLDRYTNDTQLAISIYGVYLFYPLLLLISMGYNVHTARKRMGLN